MRIWIVNAHGSLSQPHDLFAIICRNLRERCGPRGLECFVSMRMLAQLPWLDQPRRLDPSLFALELHSAWEELWTLQLSELAVPTRSARALQLGSSNYSSRAERTFGDNFAGQMHQLASFAASTTAHGTIRVATHRALAVGSSAISELRLIQGGRIRADADSLARL